MIVDPFDPQQGITPDGKPAAQVYFLPTGSTPARDLGNATFIGLADLDSARVEPDRICWRHGERDCEFCRLDAKDDQ